ncbi:MAG: transporter [Candidatus Omnitrophica bacterium]|nr:transporter [Candidatus Omnitrophota bacterium]
MIFTASTRSRSVISLLTIAFMALSYVHPVAGLAAEPAIDAQTYKQLKKELKAELKDELYAEIRAELYDEFNTTIHDLVADNIRRELKAYIAGEIIDSRREQQALINGDRPPLMPGEKLDYVVRRTVEEVFRSEQWDHFVSDEELDKIVAAGGSVEPELTIKGGYTKSSSALQSRAGGNAAPMSRADYELAGGEIRQESIERTLQSKGSILLPKGTIQIEPSFTWSHFSSNRININGFSILPVLVIGDISVQESRRDIFISSLAMKYGVLENLQAEVKVPFRGQFNRDTVSESSETTSGHSGIGDIEVGVSRQIAWANGVVPDVIAAVNFKTKTGRSPYGTTIGLGTGHYAVRGSLVAAKSSDPAVIFGSLSYTYNFEEDVNLIGKVEPGSTIGYSLGMAIALSYQTAINFSFDHSVTEKFKTAGREVDGSFLNSANVKIGANWSINDKSSVDFSVAFGVTDDAPDVTVDVRFPFIF